MNIPLFHLLFSASFRLAKELCLVSLPCSCPLGFGLLLMDDALLFRSYFLNSKMITIIYCWPIPLDISGFYQFASRSSAFFTLVILIILKSYLQKYQNELLSYYIGQRKIPMFSLASLNPSKRRLQWIRQSQAQHSAEYLSWRFFL